MPWPAAERIYVRLPNWVGDVLLATPFLHALRRAAPAARVVAHGKGSALALLEGEGLWDQGIALQRGRGPLAPWREGRRVRQLAGRPDLAFLLPNSFSAAVTAWASGASQRVGYALNLRGPLLTRALPVRKEGRLRPIPMVDYYLALLTALEADVSGVPRRPQLARSPAAEARAAAWWAAEGVDPAAQPVWAINLGGAWKTKRWIPAHAGELARALRAEGVVPLLLWGPGEEELVREAVAVAGAPVPGAERMVPLTDLAAVLRGCQLMVTTDSGPRHFGVAAGIPVLVLIGSTHPGYTDVDYDRYRLLCEEVECWPCHLKSCPIDFRCMQRLTAAKVQAAGRALLAELQGAS